MILIRNFPETNDPRNGTTFRARAIDFESLAVVSARNTESQLLQSAVPRTNKGLRGNRQDNTHENHEDDEFKDGVHIRLASYAPQAWLKLSLGVVLREWVVSCSHERANPRVQTSVSPCSRTGVPKRPCRGHGSPRCDRDAHRNTCRFD